MAKKLEASPCLSVDQTTEDIHPYEFAVKLLTHNEDTPTYTDNFEMH